MDYEAIYGNVDLAVEIMRSMLINDSYYGLGWNGAYGTNMAKAEPNDGGRTYIFINNEMVWCKDLTKEQIIGIGKVGWVSCAGNSMDLEIVKDKVVLTISSRRHGIPWKEELMRLEDSYCYRLEYISHNQNWEWYETHDDHKDENPESELYEDWGELFNVRIA